MENAYILYNNVFLWHVATAAINDVVISGFWVSRWSESLVTLVLNGPTQILSTYINNGCYVQINMSVQT